MKNGVWVFDPKPVKKDKPKKKGIRKVSPKRKEDNEKYSVLRKEFLKLYPVCLSGVCQNASTDVHHKKGRIGSLFLDTEFWMPVCRECHQWIETHPVEAKEKGYSLNRI